VGIYAGAGLLLEAPAPGGVVQVVGFSTDPGVSGYAGARRVLP
jgi:hypothetical protein